MNRQALVIGLGQFGMSVATALEGKGVEVLAVDNCKDRVRAVSPHVSEAVAIDATITENLANLSPEKRDVCLCAIGDDSKDASIICTAILAQLGAKKIVARANDDIHARILKLVGANQVVNPEKEYGDRFSSQIMHDEIRGEMLLGKDLLITELLPPQSFYGMSLQDLKLPSKYGVTVVTVKKRADSEILMPEASTKVEEGDKLVVVGKDKAVLKLIDRN